MFFFCCLALFSVAAVESSLRDCSSYEMNVNTLGKVQREKEPVNLRLWVNTKSFDKSCGLNLQNHINIYENLNNNF